jgi:ribosome-binding factor A
MKSKPSTGPTQRQLRVGEAIRHALVGILRQAHFRDPDLQGELPTIGEVRCSPDLRNATAYVIPFAAEDPAKLVKALNRAAPYLRGELAKEVELRNAPALKFVADTSLDYAGHIDELLKQHAPKAE